MNAVRYPLVGQSTVTSTKYKRAGIALLPFGSASTLNCQSQLFIGSLDFWSNALDGAWSGACEQHYQAIHGGPMEPM